MKKDVIQGLIGKLPPIKYCDWIVSVDSRGHSEVRLRYARDGRKYTVCSWFGPHEEDKGPPAAEILASMLEQVALAILRDIPCA